MENTIPFREYNLIAEYYGEAKAKRSGVKYINHIDEGLAVLTWIGASEEAMRAYCLHPIFQGDSDLAYNHSKYKIDSNIMMLVMEYRSVANAFLSTSKPIRIEDEIRLSPLKDVNDMLIADKVQNFKDFEIYHKGVHKRSYELNKYFIDWLIRLGIEGDQYAEFVRRLKA